MERARARLPKGREEDDASARELAPKLKQERARACRPLALERVPLFLSKPRRERERDARARSASATPAPRKRSPHPLSPRMMTLSSLRLRVTMVARFDSKLF